MRIDESNFGTFDRVQELCGYNYDIRWTDSHNLKGYIDPDVMLSMIEDLICEVDRRDETIEDIKKDRAENYKQITPREMYGDINDNGR
jgi:hypothetical protein